MLKQGYLLGAMTGLLAMSPCSVQASTLGGVVGLNRLQMAQAPAERTAVETEIVVSGSLSMAEAFGVGTKSQYALVWTRRLLESLYRVQNNQFELTAYTAGLRQYGHQHPRSAMQCQDSTLDVPLRQVDQDVYQGLPGHFEAQGLAALGPALRAASQDFKLQGRKNIVLISDGQLDCGDKLEDLAYQLRDQGITVHVLTFYSSGHQPLFPLAEITRGQYLEASEAQDNLVPMLYELAWTL